MNGAKKILPAVGVIEYRKICSTWSTVTFGGIPAEHNPALNKSKARDAI